MDSISKRNQILQIVAEAISDCGPNDNWTDPVDLALTSAGYATVQPERDDDPWVIAQLAEPIEGYGATIVYREGRGNGIDAYDLI